MTMHMGNQIVLWEITNYPKIKMKMIWFYIIQEKLQPFCATELIGISASPDEALEKNENGLHTQFG